MQEILRVIIAKLQEIFCLSVISNSADPSIPILPERAKAWLGRHPLPRGGRVVVQVPSPGAVAMRYPQE